MDLWMRSEVVELKDIDESFISAMRMSSTPEDWKRRGIELMNQKQFGMAMTCFERAGDKHFSELAKAYNYYHSGEKLFHKNEPVATTNFREAAKRFLVLGKPDMAGKCHVKVGDFQIAGSIYLESCKPPRYNDAGNCFEKAEKWVEAATSFFEGGNLKKSLEACILGKLLERGLLFIRQWEDHAREAMAISEFEELKNGYRWDCAELYHQQNKISTMLNFVADFSTIERKREFLRSRGYIHELMLIEEAEANHLQASELAELKGDFLHAAELLLKAGDESSAIKKLLFFIRKEVMWRSGNKEWPLRSSEICKETLHKVQELLQLTQGNINNEAKFEIDLCFADYKCLGFDQFKENIVSLEYKIEFNFLIRFLRNWDALHTCLNTLYKMKESNQQRVLAVQDIHVQITVLGEIFQCWFEWQSDIVKLKDHLSDRDFAMDFFAVSHDTQKTNTYIIHATDAYWMYAGVRKKKLSNRISVQEFEKWVGKYLDDVKRSTDQKLIESLMDLLQSLHGAVQKLSGLYLHEKAQLLLGLIDLTQMLCSTSKLKRLVHALESEVFLLLWPQSRNPQSMCHIQWIRGDSRIQCVLDSIASKLGVGNQRIATIEDHGRLELLYPFLSTTAKDEFLTGARFPAPWCNTDLKLNHELNVEGFILQFGEPLIEVFYIDWKKVRSGYITPFVFVSLLEKTVVMAISYITNLHGMIIPLTLALDFMCGKDQECFYQKLQLSDALDERVICLIGKILDVVYTLLMGEDDLCDWFSHVKELNFQNVLPTIVMRLLVILFMIYLNMNCLRSNMKNKLFTMFNQKYSSLRCLSSKVISKCKDVLPISDRAKQVNMIDDVLSTTADNLLMTKRCGNWCCRGTGMCIASVDFEAGCDLFIKFSGLLHGGGAIVHHSPLAVVQQHKHSTNIMPQDEENLKTTKDEVCIQQNDSPFTQNEKKGNHMDSSNIMPQIDENLKTTEDEEFTQKTDSILLQNEKKGNTRNDVYPI